MKKKFYTVEKALRKLKISQDQFEKLVREGTIRAYSAEDGGTKFKKDEILAYNKKAKRPNSEPDSDNVLLIEEEGSETILDLDQVLTKSWWQKILATIFHN